MEFHQDEKWASSQGPNGCLEHDMEKDSTAKSGLVGQNITTAPRGPPQREKCSLGTSYLPTLILEQYSEWTDEETEAPWQSW